MCTDRPALTRPRVGDKHPRQVVIHRHRRGLRPLLGRLGCLVCVPVLAWSASAPAAAVGVLPPLKPPLPPPLTVIRGFAAPAQPWLPGNRGVDLAATPGEPVSAVATGRVLYAGALAGRGVISIASSAEPDLRMTYEPVDPVVGVGEFVTAGDVIGHVAVVADDCGPPGSCLHWGVLRGQTYIDPMRLLGHGPVRLLPIWLDRPAGVTGSGR